MRVIRRYLFRAVVTATGLVLAVLLAVAVFIEFVTQLDDIGSGNYGILQAIIYSFLKLPNLAHQMLPMAVLMTFIMMKVFSLEYRIRLGLPLREEQILAHNLGKKVPQEVLGTLAALIPLFFSFCR
ncbi:MAG: LptF/LptG family permease, partial [Gammaproteobacteria bacterium]